MNKLQLVELLDSVPDEFEIMIEIDDNWYDATDVNVAYREGLVILRSLEDEEDDEEADAPADDVDTSADDSHIPDVVHSDDLDKQGRRIEV